MDNGVRANSNLLNLEEDVANVYFRVSCMATKRDIREWCLKRLNTADGATRPDVISAIVSAALPGMTSVLNKKRANRANAIRTVFTKVYELKKQTLSGLKSNVERSQWVAMCAPLMHNSAFIRGEENAHKFVEVLEEGLGRWSESTVDTERVHFGFTRNDFVFGYCVIKRFCEDASGFAGSSSKDVELFQSIMDSESSVLRWPLAGLLSTGTAREGWEMRAPTGGLTREIMRPSPTGGETPRELRRSPIMGRNVRSESRESQIGGGGGSSSSSYSGGPPPPPPPPRRRVSKVQGQGQVRGGGGVQTREGVDERHTPTNNNTREPGWREEEGANNVGLLRRGDDLFGSSSGEGEEEDTGSPPPPPTTTTSKRRPATDPRRTKPPPSKKRKAASSSSGAGAGGASKQQEVVLAYS